MIFDILWIIYNKIENRKHSRQRGYHPHQKQSQQPPAPLPPQHDMEKPLSSPFTKSKCFGSPFLHFFLHFFRSPLVGGERGACHGKRLRKGPLEKDSYNTIFFYWMITSLQNTVHTKTRNKLEPPGPSWNHLEQARKTSGISWNYLKPPRTRRNWLWLSNELTQKQEVHSVCNIRFIQNYCNNIWNV